jgi:hypothetical protein
MEMNLLDDVHFMLPQESDQQRKENELTELEQSSFVDFLKDADDDSVLTELEQSSFVDFLKDADDDSVVGLSEDEEKKGPADFGNHLTTFLIQYCANMIELPWLISFLFHKS